MSHKERNRRVVHEIVGHAAEQPLVQAETTVSAHDDKVGLSPFGLCDQPDSDLAIAAFDSVKDCFDPVMLEVVEFGHGVPLLGLR
jgi:hypothetical protein